MAAVNQQTMKRLMLDLKELQNSPIPVVSAIPLEDNFREWHCNIVCDGLVVHVIVFIEENYPYAAPKAEFMPMGLRFSQGATRNGTKGTQLCMSLLSNYADYHQEWKSEQNYGWSPGYTMQTLLLNLLAYVEDLKFRTPENEKLITDFACPDCGHTSTVPHPPLNDIEAGAASSTCTPVKREDKHITCYITKETINSSQIPETEDGLFGYGLEHYGKKTLPFLSSPCEFLTYGAFNNMKKTYGVVHSSVKEEITDFLPLFIHPNHGGCIKTQFEQTIGRLSNLFNKRRPNGVFLPTYVINILPNLMATTLEDFTNALEGSGDLLTGFFFFHRLFLWAVDTYPELQENIDTGIEVFLKDENRRGKKFTPCLEEWIMLLSVSSKYRWHDVAEIYISEIWKRDVQQYVEGDGLLGDVDIAMEYRIENTFNRTKCSRKRLATQIAFLNTAMPGGMSRDDVVRRYDNNLGHPTTEMVDTVRETYKKICVNKTYTGLFEVLNLTPISDAQICAALLTSVKCAIKTPGYHGSGRARSGGWKDLRLINEKKKRESLAEARREIIPNNGEHHLAGIPEERDCVRECDEEKMDIEPGGVHIDAAPEAMDVEINENINKFMQMNAIRPIPELREFHKLQRDLSFNVLAEKRKRKLGDSLAHKCLPKRARSCAAF